MRSRQPRYCRVFLIFLTLALLLPGAMAQTLNFADPSSLTHQQILIYFPNGTQYDQNTTYNTTSALTIPDGQNMLITFKPEYRSPMDDPGTWLSSSLAFISTHAIDLVLAGFLIGLLLRKR